MEILTYLRVLRRRWPLLVATLAVALGLASASAPRSKVYAATSTIVVGARQLADPSRTEASGAPANELANLTATYSVLIDSEVVAAEAVRTTGVARSPAGVVGATTATAVPGTQVLRVSVVDPVPAVAQALATGMATAFVDHIASLSPDAAPPAAVPVRLYQPAALPVAPLPTGTRTRVATAGVFGLLAAVAAVLLLEYLDQSVRTVEDAERRLGLPVLGAIPRLAEPRARG